MSSRTLFEKIEILFLVALAGACLVTFLRVMFAVPLPYELEFGEGPLLGIAVRVAHGGSPYPNPTPPPYIISPYGPIPYYLLAVLVKLFGVGFASARLAIVASGIWCALLITLLVRHATGSRMGGVAFGLLFLARPVLQDWLFVARVDLMALAFSLTGLYCFARCRRWYLSAPFFIAAFLCKSVFLTAPLACLLYTALAKKDWTKAFRFVVLTAVPAALILLLLQWGTGGWFFFHTFTASAGHPYSFRDALNRFRPQMIQDIPLLVPLVALVYSQLTKKSVGLPLFYAGVSLLITLAAVGKLGASSNYFVEWEAALCLGGGVGYSVLRTHLMRPGSRPAVLFGLFAALALANTRVPEVNYAPIPPWLTFPGPLSGCRRAYEYVKDAPESEGILTENMGELVLAGKPAIVFEPFLWTREVRSNGWPDTAVVGLIRSRQIHSIVLSNDVRFMKRDPKQERWPPSVLDAIEENYKLVRVFDCVESGFAYEPKS